MTATELEKKTSGICTRSGCCEPASETSVLCESHRIDLAERVRRYTSRVRPMRRKDGRCAGCGQPSTSYRCGDCKPRQLQLELSA